MGEKIVILGSGIIGLYTGYILSTQDKARDLTIIAEYLPGDQSINYTSPWAGANFSSISGNDEAALRYDRVSFQNLDSIFKKFGEKAGLERLKTSEYWAKAPSDLGKFDSQKQYIPDFTIVDKDKLPPFAEFGVEYTTYNFYSPKFLKFLKNYLIERGVTFIRRKLNHINEAFISAKTRVVFNCTGIGAKFLDGVNDDKMYPIRGQVVVVKAPSIRQNYSISNDNFITYVIPRPHSGGHVILGGYYQENNWTGDTFGFETESIIERTTAICPELQNEPYEIIREAAGLRPARKGGNRIEKEVLSNGRIIIHNYGAAGTGYQSGYGMATEAINLYNQVNSKL